MYHEVYTPERTHSGISLFGLCLQVYTHKDVGGITQSVPTDPNSHSFIYSMTPAQRSRGWKKKITDEKRREVCRLELYSNSSKAVCMCECVCRVANIVCPSLSKKGYREAQGKCLHRLVSLWYSQINHSKTRAIDQGVGWIYHNSLTWLKNSPYVQIITVKYEV